MALSKLAHRLSHEGEENGQSDAEGPAGAPLPTAPMITPVSHTVDSATDFCDCNCGTVNAGPPLAYFSCVSE